MATSEIAAGAEVFETKKSPLRASPLTVGWRSRLSCPYYLHTPDSDDDNNDNELERGRKRYSDCCVIDDVGCRKKETRKLMNAVGDKMLGEMSSQSEIGIPIYLTTSCSQWSIVEPSASRGTTTCSSELTDVRSMGQISTAASTPGSRYLSENSEDQFVSTPSVVGNAISLLRGLRGQRFRAIVRTRVERVPDHSNFPAEVDSFSLCVPPPTRTPTYQSDGLPSVTTNQSVESLVFSMSNDDDDFRSSCNFSVCSADSLDTREDQHQTLFFGSSGSFVSTSLQSEAIHAGKDIGDSLLCGRTASACTSSAAVETREDVHDFPLSGCTGSPSTSSATFTTPIALNTNRPKGPFSGRAAPGTS